MLVQGWQGREEEHTNCFYENDFLSLVNYTILAQSLTLI